MKKFILPSVITLCLLLFSCSNDSDDDPNPNPNPSPNNVTYSGNVKSIVTPTPRNETLLVG